MLNCYMWTTAAAVLLLLLLCCCCCCCCGNCCCCCCCSHPRRRCHLLQDPHCRPGDDATCINLSLGLCLQTSDPSGNANDGDQLDLAQGCDVNNPAQAFSLRRPSVNGSMCRVASALLPRTFYLRRHSLGHLKLILGDCVTLDANRGPLLKRTPCGALRMSTSTGGIRGPVHSWRTSWAATRMAH